MQRFKMKVPYRKNPELATRVIGDELILVPIKGQLAQLQQIYVLNGVGAFVWEHLEETGDLPSLSKELASAFSVGLKEAESDLRGYLQELQAAELLLPAEQNAH